MSLPVLHPRMTALLASAIHTTNTIVISALVLVITIIIYRLVFHPLAGIPGPKLAAVSNIWHAYHVKNGRMVHLGKTLHRQYGPVVRVGPNEVWFNSKEACQTIYGTSSGFEKSDFYLATSLTKPIVNRFLRPLFPDNLDLLSERDTKRYRLQRRLIGPVYQTSNLLRHETAIDTVIKDAIARLKGLKGAEVDLNEWMHIIAVECLGAVVLSWSPGMLKNGTDWGTGPHAYASWRRKSVFGLFPLVTRLEIWSKSIGRAFSTLWGVNFKTPKNFKPFFISVNNKILRRSKTALRPNPPKDKRTDLMADLTQLHKSKPAFSEVYLRRMAMTNFGAGHETMASTLTSIMATLGTHPDLQAVLANEILTTPNPTSYASASRLPLTQAIIKESRRLNPVISMSLPRTVPSSGLSLHGFYFPPGTTVGCNPVALHRNPEIFGERPEEFDIRRWLDGDVERVRGMERWNLGWGGGARTCPGKNLAEIVVCKVVSALVKEFEIEVTVPGEEEIRSYFLSIMMGAKVRFIERDVGQEDSKTR